MSLLIKKKIHVYSSPVAIGPNSISSASSWVAVHNQETRKMNLHSPIKCIYRVGFIELEYFGSKFCIFIDWIVSIINKKFKYFVEIKYESALDLNVTEFPNVNELIHQKLNETKFVHNLQYIFQQEQPGEGSASAICGKTGNEGESQSD